jgi:radical SAM enzyme (TIGR01210 family)
MIKYLSEFLIIDSTIINYLEACVESNDTRGLFFYLCKKYNLSYDKLIEQNYINYEYNPPTINKQWQKKYKKDGNPIVFWFYESLLGKSLFLVLYGPKCRYKIEKGGCSGCNLPSVSSPNSEINDLDIKRQIDSTFNNNLSDLEKLSIKELILSNNGSILDNKTISKEALQYSVEHAITNLTNLKKIILETRIDHYTNFEQLSELYLKVKNLNQNISIELAIGFEIFDDELRNGYYKKGLEKSILEMKLSELSTIDISLKIYMMYKAVPDKYMDVDAAICDINNGSKYFSDLASKYNSSLNIHISPTYLATGTQLYKDYKDGLYTPLTTQDIKKLYDQLNIYDNISYYISMNDEGLTDDRLLNGSDYSEYIELSKKIHEFNITQYR